MKVGLVLGGGGARGFAHIGVLRALAERGLETVAVAGCSMGGIVGALHAAGHAPDEIHAFFSQLNWTKILDWGHMGALVGGRGIAHQMRKHLPETFEQLEKPLRVTAVDVQEGRSVTLWEGDLVAALRASSAIPGIFSPVEVGDRILVDGGLLNNVPVDEMRSMTHAPIVAVDVTPPANRKIAFEDDRTFWEKLVEPLQPGKRHLWAELLIKAYDIPAAVLNDVRLAAQRPDVVIRPPLEPDLKVEDFKRLDEAVEAGYREARRVLDAQTRSEDT